MQMSRKEKEAGENFYSLYRTRNLFLRLLISASIIYLLKIILKGAKFYNRALHLADNEQAS
jgi:hypothetical protein